MLYGVGLLDPRHTALMLSEDYEKMMLVYLSGLMEGPGFHKPEDLNRLSSRDLLLLAVQVDDSALGLFVQLLKSSQAGERLFEKLMGDHEEENRQLVDAFFSRYFNVVLSGVQEGEHFNPLEAYIPAHTFDDLAFIQSRQAFFLRQTIETINEYLNSVFPHRHNFSVGEQQLAWEYFWGKIMAK
jgi:hypothetical protein